MPLKFRIGQHLSWTKMNRVSTLSHSQDNILLIENPWGYFHSGLCGDCKNLKYALLRSRLVCGPNSTKPTLRNDHLFLLVFYLKNNSRQATLKNKVTSHTYDGIFIVGFGVLFGFGILCDSVGSNTRFQSSQYSYILISSRSTVLLFSDFWQYPRVHENIVSDNISDFLTMSFSDVEWTLWLYEIHVVRSFNMIYYIIFEIGDKWLIH